VAKATDGHTFGMNNSQLTVAKLLSPKIGYDPARDLAPIALTWAWNCSRTALGCRRAGKLKAVGVTSAPRPVPRLG
jgi:hypothetical protein